MRHRLPPGQRQPRKIDAKHIAAIRQCPCVICGGQAEAAHVRAPSLAHGKSFTGIGRKPDDKWTLPLCPRHHRLDADSQHTRNEMEFWRAHGIDPFRLCEALYAVSPDVARMTTVVNMGGSSCV